MLSPDAPEARRRLSLENELRPLLPFLGDPIVQDVMVNADGSVWIDRAGHGMSRSSTTVRPHQVESLLKTIAAGARRELGPGQPSLQAELPPWSNEITITLRVQGLLPPIVSAPVLAIRKPAALVFPLDRYAEVGILPSQAPAAGLLPSRTSGWAARWRTTVVPGATLLDRIKEAIRQRANILISGGTGTGKTTFANSVLGELAASADRIFLVEDTRELRCQAANQISVRVAGDSYTWRNAIADAMRMRPDRILVGEVRDGAALDLVKAWNTGHPGGLATVHANDPSGALDRICQLIEEVLPSAPRRLVADAINVVLHLERDGRHPAGRRLAAAALVEGLASDGTWILSPL